MATTTYWTGGANDGNWSTAGNWSAGAPSGTTFHVIIDDTAQTIDAGLSQGTVTLLSMKVTNGFKGNIGASGTSLDINSASTRIATSGKYINLAGDHTILIVEPAGQSEINLTGDLANTTRIVRGDVTIGTSCAISNLEIDGGSVEIGAHASLRPALKQNGGYVVSERNLSSARINGGTHIMEVAAGVTGVCDIGGNGVLIKRSSGTIGTLTKFSTGKYSMSGATDPTTITTGFIYGSGFEKSGGGVETTVTTENNYGGGGNT